VTAAGLVLAPPALAEVVAAQKLISDRGSSTLDQLALAGHRGLAGMTRCRLNP
jgi:DNA-binding transcriptional MocR family regulator